MKQVRKSVLLWYSPAEMYALVTDVESYPQFLPWCSSAELLERFPDGITARLGLSYMGVKRSFTTRNHHVDARSVHIELVDGPFSDLDGTWNFLPIGPTPSDAQATEKVNACKIEFGLRYAFAGSALDHAISPVFDRIANTFVDAFVTRAESVYGVR
ncbi:MAG: type II toxin-antitoxin system RatA family toxin [Pseudomonadota bacterium]|nr:type II toxin-antitoxin system RatA family toxin [Pseudomonadota bacterium]